MARQEGSIRRERGRHFVDLEPLQAEPGRQCVGDLLLPPVGPVLPQTPFGVDPLAIDDIGDDKRHQAGAKVDRRC